MHLITKQNSCTVLINADDFAGYGVEYTDPWGKTKRIQNITTDAEFFLHILNTISGTNLDAEHLRDVIEDLIAEKYTVEY